MGILEIILIGIGLSMDAFAVSVCKGLSVKEKLKWYHFVIVGAWFGCFQALMPSFGYLLGTTFQQYITEYDHWIAFALLVVLGLKMIADSFSKKEEKVSSSFSNPSMFVNAVATSIDALAIGVTFALLEDVNVPLAVSIIGVTTFILSGIGLKIGNLFGAKFEKKATFVGGVILVLLGVKILLEHLGVINF